MDVTRRRWLAGAALSAVTVAVFAQTVDHAFIAYDDDVFITGNPHLALGLSREGVRWAFLEPYRELWIPLTYLSWLAEYELGGLDPRLHHLDSLWLHLGSALLLFGFLTRTTRTVWRSAFVALVFAVHPLHVESVAWATERRDTLSVFFWMLAMWFHAGYAARPSSRTRFLAVVLCGSLSLLAKPLAVTLPFALLLLDLWPLQRLSSNPSQRLFECGRVRRAVLEKLFLLPLVVFTCALTIRAQSAVGAMSTFEAIPLALRLGNAVNSYALYLAKAFWPVDLGVFYPHPLASLAAGRVVAAALLLAVLTALALRAVRSRPWLTVGWLWFVGTLVPMIGIVQVGMQGIADRYTYVPLTGIAIIVAWGGFELLGATRRGRIALAAAGVGAGLALSIAAWVQVGYWRDTIALFAHTARVTEKNAVAHAVLGRELMRAGRPAEALPHLRAAVSLEPRWVTARWVLGDAFAALGRNTEAIHMYRVALSLDRSESGLHAAIGELLESTGRRREAIEHFEMALRLGAGGAAPGLHARLGGVYAEVGDFGNARRHLTEALRADSELPGVREQLRALRGAGRAGGPRRRRPRAPGGLSRRSSAARETR